MFKFRNWLTSFVFIVCGGLAAVFGQTRPEIDPTLSAPTVFQAVPSTFSVPIAITDVSSLGIFAYQFELHYDPAVIDPSGPNAGCSTAGTLTAAAGLSATCNVSPDGTLRVSVFGVTPMTGAGTILNISFATDPTAVGGNFSNLNFANFFFFNSAGATPISTTSGRITLLSPTTASAVIEGRALTASGKPVFRAKIVLTDRAGRVRYALAGPFGNFRFRDIPVGEDYSLTVQAKGKSFGSRSIPVGGDVLGLDLYAEP